MSIRPTPGVWTVATAAYAVLYVAFERAGVGTEPLRYLVSNLAFLPLNLLVAVLNLLASRHPSLDIGVRRALRLLGAGAIMVLLGNLISVSYFFRPTPSTWPTAASRWRRCCPSRSSGGPVSTAGSSSSTRPRSWWAAGSRSGSWPSGRAWT